MHESGSLVHCVCVVVDIQPNDIHNSAYPFNAKIPRKELCSMCILYGFNIILKSLPFVTCPHSWLWWRDWLQLWHTHTPSAPLYHVTLQSEERSFPGATLWEQRDSVKDITINCHAQSWWTMVVLIDDTDLFLGHSRGELTCVVFYSTPLASLWYLVVGVGRLL